MVVYVESNFVLEHALQQEQFSSCEQIIKLAESKQVSLAIPAFALAEPYQTLNARKNLRNKLSDHLSELEKSELYQKIASDFEPFVRALRNRAARSVQRHNWKAVCHCNDY